MNEAGMKHVGVIRQHRVGPIDLPARFVDQCGGIVVFMTVKRSDRIATGPYRHATVSESGVSGTGLRLELGLKILSEV
jgi:hypothetical protein